LTFEHDYQALHNRWRQECAPKKSGPMDISFTRRQAGNSGFPHDGGDGQGRFCFSDGFAVPRTATVLRSKENQA